MHRWKILASVLGLAAAAYSPLASAVQIQAVASNTAWNQERSNAQNTGFAAGTKTAPNLTVKWSSTGHASYLGWSPVSYDRRTYLPDGAGLRAFDASTGALHWTAPQGFLFAPPACGKAQDGSTLVWCVSGTSDGYAVTNPKVTCLKDLGAGYQVLWSTPLQAYQASHLLLSKGRIHVSFTSGSHAAVTGQGLAALDAATGTLVFQTAFPGTPVSYTKPVAAEGLVFTCAPGVGLVGLDASGNAAVTLQGVFPASAPAFDRTTRRLLVEARIPGTYTNSLRCYDLSNGTLSWDSAALGITGPDYGTGPWAPVIARGKVYTRVSGSTIHALDPTSGLPVWSLIPGGNVSAVLVTANGRLWMTRDSGNPLCVDADTGSVLGQASVPADPLADMAPDADGLFVLQVGTLHRLGQ